MAHQSPLTRLKALVQADRQAAIHAFCVNGCYAKGSLEATWEAEDLDWYTRHIELRTIACELSADPSDVTQLRAWKFCPECGCEEIHHQEGDRKQCANCHQEWFSDMDYTDVVRTHLAGKFRDKDAVIEAATKRADAAEQMLRELHAAGQESEELLWKAMSKADDMLSGKLPSSEKPECQFGYGHGGVWCGPKVKCWLDPRSKEEREA